MAKKDQELRAKENELRKQLSELETLRKQAFGVLFMSSQWPVAR